MIRLGVNIDHVATLRQARKGKVPDTVQAARESVRGGADGITVHLREDRRHIQDHDVRRLKKILKKPINLEMSMAPSIVKFALKVRPAKVCLVPEKRQELTTEGGLDAIVNRQALNRMVPRLQAKGIEVSLFIDPEISQVREAKGVGAETIELHTGTYANAKGTKKKKELVRLHKAAVEGHRLGLKINVGHGLDYENVKDVVKLPFIEEANIGHSIVSHAVFVGLRQAVRKMKQKLRNARS